MTAAGRVKVPWAPLADHLDRLGGIDGALNRAGLIDHTRTWSRFQRALERGRAEGHVSVDLADRVACQILGHHPSLIWGPAWWRATADAVEVERRTAAARRPRRSTPEVGAAA